MFFLSNTAEVDMIPKSLSTLFGTMYGKKASVSSAISLAKELPLASDAQVSGTLVLLLEFNPYQLDPCSHFVLKKKMMQNLLNRTINQCRPKS